MLEDHVLALTSVRWQALEKLMEADPHFAKIKQKGVNSFYWCGLEDLQECENRIHQLIRKDPIGRLTVYQISPILNGKRDVFGPDKTREQKLEMPYFHQRIKDLREREIAAWLKAHDPALLESLQNETASS